MSLKCTMQLQVDLWAIIFFYYFGYSTVYTVIIYHFYVFSVSNESLLEAVLLSVSLPVVPVHGSHNLLCHRTPNRGGDDQEAAGGQGEVLG